MTENTARRGQDLQYTGIGVGIGAGVGATIGVLVGGGAGIALGLCCGAGLGVVLGAAIDARKARTRHDGGSGPSRCAPSSIPGSTDPSER